MNLKEATNITKSFKQGGNTYIPAISDDWTLNIETMYSYGDKPIISSEKLGYSITLSIDISQFFREWIFSGNIKLEKNKLIGEFSFNKEKIFTPDIFNEAVRIIEDNNLIEPISNDDLIEYGLYLDSTGKKYTYIGNREIFYYRVDKNSSDNIIMNLEKRPRNRYLLNEDETWKNKVTIKNSKKEFVEFLGTSNLEKMDEIKKRFLSYDKLICSQSSYNVVDEINIDSQYFNSFGFIFFDKKYYIFHKKYKNQTHGYGGYEYSLNELDFNEFKKHLADKDMQLNSFFIGDPIILNDNEMKEEINKEDFRNFKIYAYYE